MNKLGLLLSAMGGAPAPSQQYVDDVFATYVHTGTGASTSIVNGIDTSTKSALVWTRQRNANAASLLFDTLRGTTYYVSANATAINTTLANSLTAFNTNGFTLGTASSVNGSGSLFVSWTFQKANKFFDLQTKVHTTGTPSTVDLSSLGTVGFVVVKSLTSASDWWSWHISNTAGNNQRFNTTAAQTTTNANLSVSGTTLTISGSHASGTYLIYAWAHDTSTDGLIRCGTYTGNGSATAGPVIDLGWEPQWILVKSRTAVSNWAMIDISRGWPANANQSMLYNSATTEVTSSQFATISATGFQVTTTGGDYNTNGGGYNYIAIRRSNKPPTSGSQVFQPLVYTGNNATIRTVNVGIPVDTMWLRQRSGTGAGNAGFLHASRIRGQNFLKTGLEFSQGEATTANVLAQQASGYGTSFTHPAGIWIGNNSGTTITNGNINANTTSNNHIALGFKRASRFMDIIYYTGDSTEGRMLAHGLGTVPELVIIRATNSSTNYTVWHKDMAYNYQLNLDVDAAQNGPYNDGLYGFPTATALNLSGKARVNGAFNYLAWVFATLPGISKVGSFVGNGAAADIDCGFSSGARFVLVKALNAKQDWYVIDSARGITSGSDPYLTTNLSTAEASANLIAPYSGGFRNTGFTTSGTTYIFLAIA